jgi:hypothetical protein
MTQDAGVEQRRLIRPRWLFPVARLDHATGLLIPRPPLWLPGVSPIFRLAVLAAGAGAVQEPDGGIGGGEVGGEDGAAAAITGSRRWAFHHH